MQPCLFTAISRHGFFAVNYGSIEQARAEIIEAFNEGKCDNLLMMFLIPLKEAA